MSAHHHWRSQMRRGDNPCVCSECGCRRRTHFDGPGRGRSVYSRREGDPWRRDCPPCVAQGQAALPPLEEVLP